MAENSILIAVADPQGSVDIAHALGSRWEVTTVASVAEALAQLKKKAFNVLVADLSLPSPGGAELLNQARKNHSETIRFLLAQDADRERVLKKVLGAHQIIAKPVDYPSLKNTIENAVAVDVWIANKRIRDLVARVNAFPTIPSLYVEVLNALKSPSATTEQVGEIITKDMAMMTKLLQVINSAYFGLPRKITDAAEAVGLLGFETVKSMVMSVKFLSQYNQVKPGYFSVERLWQHSTEVARTAKELVLLETKDRTLASEAFTAGLLHDLGKVVLAANFDDQYSGAHSLARKQQIPLWEIEKEIFGASHGEIGAYLFGMWGMPLPILEAAALHHEPSRTGNKTFAPLAAVHIANALEYEVRGNEEGLLIPRIDEAFLAELGLLERLPVWRAAMMDGDFANSEFKGKSSETDRWESIPPVPTTPPPPRPEPSAPPVPVVPPPQPAVAETSGAADTAGFAPGPLPHRLSSSRSGSNRRWVYAGAATVLLVLTLLWVGSKRPSSEPEPVYARTPAPEEAAGGRTAATNAQEVTVGSAAEATPAAAPAATDSESTSTNQTSVTGTGESKLGLAPAVSVSTSSDPSTKSAPVVETNLASFGASPKEAAPPVFRLYGIIYATGNPSAIINGNMVQVGDHVNGALVVDIRRTNVTLQVNGQRTTYTLR